MVWKQISTRVELQMVLLVIYFVWRENTLLSPRAPPTPQKKVRHEFMGNLDRARWENYEVGLEEKHVSRGSMGVGKKHWLMSTREYLLQMRY